MRKQQKTIAILLLLIMVFGWFGAMPEIVDAASDPRDINPPRGAEITVKGKPSYAAGYWTIYVDGRMTGNALATTDKFDQKGGIFGGIRNMLHQSTLNSWYNSFIPSPSPTGYYEGATFSRTPMYVLDLETVIYNGRSSPRMHIRELAKQVGAQVDYDAKAQEVYVSTSNFPTGAITFPSGLKEGDSITFQIRGTSYGGTEIVRSVFKVDNSTKDDRSPNSSSFSNSVNHILGSGQQELRLEITDSAGRKTTYRQYISPAGKPVPPAPPTPNPSVGRPVADFTMPSMAADWDPVRIKNTSLPPKGGRLVDAQWEVSTTRYEGKLDFDGGTLYFERPNREYEVTLTVTDNNGNTDSVTKSIFITEWVPPDYGEDPEPEPELLPPWADFELPDEVFQGEKVKIVNTSTDSDGEIVENKWSIDIGDKIEDVWDSLSNDEDPPLGWTLNPGMGVSGSLEDTGGIITFPEEGIYTVTLRVIDNDGLWDIRPKTIAVLPAVPKAYFNWTGTPKENRKMVLDATQSFTPEFYPIDWSKTEWEIVPPESVDADSIKIVTSTDLSKQTLLFKEAGDYKVRLRVTNTGGLTSEWYEEIIKIYPDEPPVADFYVVKAVTRDGDNNKKAAITLYDQSFSPDGDTIVKRTWRYKYDSNNDGNFTDEPWQMLDSGNNMVPVLNTDQVGKYLFELSIEEGFGQETIAEFINDKDVQKADTTRKPLAERTVEVINIAPLVGFSPITKKKVDIVFTIGDAPNKINDLPTKIVRQIETKLNAVNIEYGTIKSIDTIQENITTGIFKVHVWWPNDENDMDAHMSFYSQGSKQGEIYYYKRNLYGCSLDHDDLSGGTGEWLTLNFDTIPSYIDELRFEVNPYRGSSKVTIKLFKDDIPMITKDKNVRDYNGRTYFGKLIRNGTTWDFYGADGEFISGEVVHKKTKTLDDVLKEPNWRPGALRFLVNISDIIYSEFNNPAKAAVIFSRLINDDIHFNVLGITSNQSQAQNIISQNNDKGIFINNSNMDNALSQIADYIISQVEKQQGQYTQYILLEEEIGYETYYSDTERDPEFSRRWIYDHDQYYFDNSMGRAVFHDQYIPLPITRFSQVGKYDVVFQARDNPKSDFRFDGYRLWSSMPLDSLTIYVHRKPLALYSASVVPSGNSYSLVINDSSYDPDHQTRRTDKGIVAREWRWKEATAPTWNSGLPSSLPAGKTYLVSLRVKDPEGIWSDYNVRVVTTDTTNLPPVAQFTVSPNPLPLGKTLNHQDFSYDPNGDAIVERTWRYQKPDGSWVNSGTVFPSNVYNSLGKYRIELKVKDDKNAWSEPFYQAVEVIPENRKPIAQFTVAPNPLPLDVLATYNDTSYDPDGDPIVAREWQYQKNGGSWMSGQPFDFNTSGLGIGSYNIRLRVKDQPALAQMTSLWSEWYSRPLQVIAGNQPPVARFTLSPNPVPADESVTYLDTSYDPEGLPLAERIWQVRKPDGTVLGEYRNQLPPRVFETTGWGVDRDGVGTYIIALRVKDQSPNGISPALWSNWYTQTLIVEDPLNVIGDTDQDTYMAGQAMLLNAFTEGRAYKVEARVWFKNKHTNTDVTQLIPERYLGNPPQKEMEWRTRRFKDDPGGRDLVVIIPPEMPDGTYQVEFTAYKESQDGTIKTAHDTIAINVKGVVYDRSHSQIIGGPR